MIALDPKTLGETLGDVRTLAEATGRTREGVELVARAAARIDRVELAVRGAERPRVAAVEWLDPVFVAGHWTPQLVELAGGEDVLGMPGEPSETTTWEALAGAAPEVVVVMPCGYDAPARPSRRLSSTPSICESSARRGSSPSTPPPTSRVPARGSSTGSSCSAASLHPDLLARCRSTAARSSSRRSRAAGGLSGSQAKPVPLTFQTAIDAATAIALISRHATKPSAGIRRPSAARIASAASAPPISPPMWAPTEMPARVKLKTRFRMISPPIPDCMTLKPRARSSTAAAPISPKIAPEAPSVGAGVAQQRAEGAGQQRGEVDRREARAADRGLEHQPEDVQQVHVEGDVRDVLVQEAGGDEAVVVVAFGDRFAVEHAFGDHLAVDARCRTASAAPPRSGTRSR